MRYTGHFTIVDEVLGQNELSINSYIRTSKILSIKEESQLLMNYFQHHILDNCVFVLTDGDRSLLIKCHARSIYCMRWNVVLDVCIGLTILNTHDIQENSNITW